MASSARKPTHVTSRKSAQVPGQLFGPPMDTAEDRLMHGDAVPGGPGACARCGHLTLWHGQERGYRRYHGKPCRQCLCTAYTDQPETSADPNKEPQ